MRASGYLKREILVKIAKLQLEGKLEDGVHSIPRELAPKDSQSIRCCIYHDREILRQRVMARLGHSVEDYDDEKDAPLSLKDLAKTAALPLLGKKKEKIDITNNVKSYAIPDDAWDDSVGDLREEYWHALDTFDCDELVIKVTFENGEIQEKKYELHTAKVNIENGVVEICEDGWSYGIVATEK